MCLKAIGFTSSSDIPSPSGRGYRGGENQVLLTLTLSLSRQGRGSYVIIRNQKKIPFGLEVPVCPKGISLTTAS
jgi:hypothetical protein